MQHLFLIRHAPVTLDLAVPSEHWQLSAEGHTLAERLAALPVLSGLYTVWTSPEAKARSTAQPLARRHTAALLVHPDLAELRRGPTNLPDQDAYHAAVHAALTNPARSVGGWERACDAQQRIVGCVREITAQTTGPLAIVSHGLVLSLLLAYLRQQAQVDVAEWRAIPLPALAIVDYSIWQVVTPWRAVAVWESQQ